MSVETENYAKRRNAIAQILTPIRPWQGRARCPVGTFTLQEGGRYIIVAADQRSNAGYRDWLFRTAVQSVWGHYSEQWTRGTTRYVLHQVSLQLYVATGPSENQRQEVFALHCEPHIQEESLRSRCKREPHVHITADRNVLAHAHIPIHVLSGKQALSSEKRFTQIFCRATEIIEHEILGELSNTSGASEYVSKSN